MTLRIIIDMIALCIFCWGLLWLCFGNPWEQEKPPKGSDFTAKH